jgi:hypothetical protein
MMRRIAVALLTVAMAGGCVTRETRPLPLSAPVKATAAVPESQLLDVGVRLFEPNIPESEKEQQARQIDPEVRKAEARYMPVKLADTLEGTGFWGQVRVVPVDVGGLDVSVAGAILVANGSTLKLDIRATDSTGRVWLQKVYEGAPDLRSYKTGATTKRDPFQNVYVAIADDLAAARGKLSATELTQIQRTSELRFNAELAPYAFDSYLKRGRDGRIAIVRLPAGDDPLANRLAQVRERDYALLDTLDDQYALSAEQLNDSYLNWRRANHSELEETRDAKNSARTRMLLGAAAVVGGVVAAADSSSTTATQVAGAVAVAGGYEAFRSGMGKRAEAKAHSESIKQQLESFSTEVAPVNVTVDGRVLELRGNSAQQFSEWRRLLKDLYQIETGAAPATGSASGVTPP